MSMQHAIAVSIEHRVENLLDYEPYNSSNPEASREEKIRAIEDNIGADFFDQTDNITYLQNATKRIIESLEISKDIKKSLVNTVQDMETVPFEKAAHYWELIIELLWLVKK